MSSLLEQFLSAGLVSQKKAKQVNQEKGQQKKTERRTGVQAVDEAKAAAKEVRRLKAERARELNAQRDAAARQNEIAVQIKQMVLQSRQSKGAGDFAYNFTYDNKVKRIYVSADVQAHLVAGRLVIVCQGESFELVPKVVADKIAERDASLVVRVNKASSAVDENDPYADYKIPDDFTW